VFALFGSFFLERGCGAQGGVESQVVGFSISRARLDVAPAFALGMCAATPPAEAPCYPVERVLDFARQESGPDFYFFAAIPPVSG
jgi:hypothetical protein